MYFKLRQLQIQIVHSRSQEVTDESNITSSTSDMEINSNVQTDLQGSEDDVDNQGGPS